MLYMRILYPLRVGKDVLWKTQHKRNGSQSIKESAHQLFILYRNDIVQILLYIGEQLIPGRFHRRAVGYGIDALQCHYLSRWRCL